MDVIKFSVPKFFQSLMEVLTSDVLKKKKMQHCFYFVISMGSKISHGLHLAVSALIAPTPQVK